MTDARKGMQIPVPPIGPRHIDNGSGRPGSEPTPLELGQDTPPGLPHRLPPPLPLPEPDRADGLPTPRQLDPVHAPPPQHEIPPMPSLKPRLALGTPQVRGHLKAVVPLQQPEVTRTPGLKPHEFHVHAEHPRRTH